jgi:hypothetical protein
MTNTKQTPQQSSGDARLDAIAREIEAKLAKADKSQAYTDDMVTSVDQLIAEAAVRCKKLKLSFNAWLKKCPSIRKSRAYEKRAVVLKLKTAEEVRADTRKRLAKHVVEFSVNGKTVKLGGAADIAAETTCPGRPQPLGAGDEAWHTPIQYLKLIDEVLGGIDCCPASNAYAQKRYDFGPECVHYTKKENALLPTNPWRGRTYLNPPYTRGVIGPFVDKLLRELKSGNVPSAFLVVQPEVGTTWFQKAARASSGVFFSDVRIPFEKTGGKKGSPPWGGVIFYFGPDRAKFEKVFSPHGICLRVVTT